MRLGRVAVGALKGDETAVKAVAVEAQAKAAGVSAIGVAWGYHAPEELIAAGADFVAAHPREVAEFMKVGA